MGAPQPAAPPSPFTPPAMTPPSPSHTTMTRLGRGLAASFMTATVLLGLFLTAVPIYITLLRATLPKVVDVNEPLFFDYRLPQPAATMPLLPPELRSKAYQYAAEDKPVKKFPRVFTPGQRYDVTVRLELPDSEQNMEVGMFQVTVQLLSARDDVVATTTQPAMLHYRSQLVKLVRLMAMAIPLVFNFVEERQVLILPMLKGYQEGPLPVIAVRVLIEPSAGRPPSLGLPQIYSAEAEVKTRLTGLAALLYNWRFTSFVWGPFVIFMWELSVAVLCCPGLVLPGFLRKKAEAPARPPVAPPVRAPMPPAEEELLRTGAAVVGDLEDLESLGIDDIPKDERSAAATSANASGITNGESTAFESEYTLAGGRRVSIGTGVGIGSPARRRSTGSRGQRSDRTESRERAAGPILADGKWDDSMERALEDILEARVSPEASETSEGDDDIVDDVIGEDEEGLGDGADGLMDGDDVMAEGDDDMPVLEDGAAQEEGKEEKDVGLVDSLGLLGEAALLEGEATVLQVGQGFSKLNDLVEGRWGGENGSAESSGAKGKQKVKRPEDIDLLADSLGVPVRDEEDAGSLARSTSSGNGRAQSGTAPNGARSTPRRSQSLDSATKTSSTGATNPDQDSGSGNGAVPEGRSDDGASQGESLRVGSSHAGEESPQTGVYSQFLSRGLAGNSTIGSLPEESVEKRGVNKQAPKDVGGSGNIRRALGESEEAEFKDAVDTLTPQVSNASMQEAVEDNDWFEVPRAEAERGNGTIETGTEQGEGEDEEKNEKDPESGMLDPLVGALRRRGWKKQE